MGLYKSVHILSMGSRMFIFRFAVSSSPLSLLSLSIIIHKAILLLEEKPNVLAFQPKLHIIFGNNMVWNILQRKAGYSTTAFLKLFTLESKKKFLQMSSCGLYSFYYSVTCTKLAMNSSTCSFLSAIQQKKHKG